MRRQPPGPKPDPATTTRVRRSPPARTADGASTTSRVRLDPPPRRSNGAATTRVRRVARAGEAGAVTTPAGRNGSGSSGASTSAGLAAVPLVVVTPTARPRPAHTNGAVAVAPAPPAPAPVEGRDDDRTPRWMPGVEALRGMAAMAVVASHLWALTSHPTFPGYRFLYGLSLWAVDLFFLLSGFVLVQCFWGPRPQALRQYYARRFLRIAPAYYVNIAILFLFFADRALLFSDTGLRQVIANLSFTQWLSPTTSTSLNVNGVFWTLSIEMTLYALMPLLAALIARRPVLAGASLFAVGMAYRIFVAVDPGPLQSWAFQSLPDQPEFTMRLYLLRQFVGILPLFVLGMLLRWWLHFRPGRAQPAALRRELTLRRLVLLLAPSVAVLALVEQAADYRHRVLFVVFDIVICLLVAPALLVAGRWAQAAVGRPLGVLVWLGRRSYGIYLWHFPVILLVFERGPLTDAPDLTYIWLRVALVVSCSVALGALSYALIERPASRAARRVAPPVASPEPDAAPAGRRFGPLPDPLGLPAALTSQTLTGQTRSG